jgi:antimicrobial peptide system SdpA family protein
MLSMSAVVAVVGLYAIHPAMPHNPIHLPMEKSVSMPMFVPEGWKFFTRDPQEEQYFIVKQEGSRWVSPDNTNNGSPVNLFGASRRGRAMFVEMGALSSEVPDWRWSDCKGDVGPCLDAFDAPVRVKSSGARPQLCGAIGVAKRKIVPWAWSSSPRPVVMPSKVLRLEVQC